MNVRLADALDALQALLVLGQNTPGCTGRPQLADMDQDKCLQKSLKAYMFMR